MLIGSIVKTILTKRKRLKIIKEEFGKVRSSHPGNGDGCEAKEKIYRK